MKDILATDKYDFVLPKELIAQEPVKNRGESRLMVYYRSKDKIEHLLFKDIVSLLDARWCIVLNTSQVVRRKVYCRKSTGGKIGVIITDYNDGLIKCILSPYKKLSLQSEVILPNGTSTKVVDKDSVTGEFFLQGNFKKEQIEEMLKTYAYLPLPPYIKRAENDPRNTIDFDRYQTVYAKEGSSIAAPTAGLHFSNEILAKLEEKNVKIAYIRLDVGLSSFKLVKENDISKITLYPEWAEVSEEAVKKINSSDKILCVGTTTVRVMEYLYQKFRQVSPYKGWVDIYIYPGYKFGISSAMVTNFHLPKSTNLILVSAFVGREKLLELYNVAIQNKYRFYSYGDAMLII